MVGRVSAIAATTSSARVHKWPRAHFPRLKALAHPPPLVWWVYYYQIQKRKDDFYDYTVAVGGAAPVNPCPRNARGGAVFFIVLFWLFFVVYGLFFFSFVVVWLSSPFSGVFCVFRLVVVCCRSGCLFASPFGGSAGSSPCGGHRFFIRR